MGVFGIGTNDLKVNSGVIRGKVYQIACMAWFAPGQPPQPHFFKYEGEDGVLQTISDLKISYTDNKCYNDESVYEYRCEAVIGGIRFGFKLIFYVMNSRWFMVI